MLHETLSSIRGLIVCNSTPIVDIKCIHDWWRQARALSSQKKHKPQAIVAGFVLLFSRSPLLLILQRRHVKHRPLALYQKNRPLTSSPSVRCYRKSN